MIKAVNKFLFLLMCPGVYLGQVNFSFLKHLEDNNLYTEHLAYLNSIKSDADTLHNAKAEFYLKYFNDSLFLLHFSRSKNLCLKDSLMMKRASLLMMESGSEREKRAWFNMCDTLYSKESLEKINLAFKMSEDPHYYKVIRTENGFSASFLAYKKIMQKKPGLAAVYSAIIPGTGKVYAGKTLSGLSAFLLNAVYGAQTWESYTKLGIRHPLTWFNSATFAVFYFSNVYGSYKGILDLRKERKQQFIKDVTFFYN